MLSTKLDQLLTEQSNPASAAIDMLPTAEMLAVINREDARVAASVETEIPRIARAVDLIVERLSAGGRLFYIGAGTSGRLGVLDASECPPTYNVPWEMVQGVIAGGETALTRSVEAIEDDPEQGARDIATRRFGGGDVLVGIAASGRTPYVLGAVAAARALGAVTVGISCTPNSELSRAVDVAIEPLPGPEVVTGSTRMKAGTATKLVLNMLSTGAMIRLGHVFGNLMVNVQPKNVKLVDRAQRIVAQATACDAPRAAVLLDASGSNVKIAIVMGRLGVSREEAAGRLEAAGGRIAVALSRAGASTNKDQNG
jgi:N-acetylmuramic acid 6-phosphate etherase